MITKQEKTAFSPNRQQQAVFNWSKHEQGNLNLVALAGTGKTTTLVQLLPYLDGQIYFGAFGKDIVKAIRSKIDDLGILGLKDRTHAKTVHSLGLSTWSKACKGYSTKIQQYKIHNILDELDVQEPKAGFKSNKVFITKAVDYAKQSGFGVLTRLRDLDNWYEMIDHFNLENDIKGANPDIPNLIAMAIRIFDISIGCCKHEIDFNDMLLAPLYHGIKFPTYDWVLIDEAQDISPLRLAILCKLVGSKSRVIAVGDPHQAIMGFSGAASESMEEIKERFDSIELPLSVTYRLPKVGVEEAQKWVPEIEAHPDAKMGNLIHCNLKPQPATEAEPIPQAGFWDLGPFTAKDAILCRNTRPIVELAYQFLRKRIPARVEGRDIGNGLINLATRWKIDDLDQLEIKLSEYVERETRKLNEMKQLGKAANVQDQVETLLVLIQATQMEGGKTIDDLTRLVTSMFGDTPEGEKPKCLTLSTVHKSKGREWDRVFILGMNKYMPSPWAVKPWEQKQEANLCYVAVTRFIDTLVYVTVPEK